MSDQRDFLAKGVGVDPKTDLAVLKINTFRSLPQPSFGLSRNVEVGQWVMAIGNPYGLQGSVTVGVISGVPGPISALQPMKTLYKRMPL